MRIDIYQAETQRLAYKQAAMLDEAKNKLQTEQQLSALEQAGVLHALQVITENAIGKAKHMLKALGEPVPISAYDAFASLSRLQLLNAKDLHEWNNIIGMRNRIVHDYMNLNMELILGQVAKGQYRFVTDFLMRPMQDSEAH